MDIDQIKAIIAMMKENDLTEFSMEQNGLKIRIKRGPEGVQQVISAGVTAAALAPAAGTAAAGRSPEPAPVAPAQPEEGLLHVTSPMVGTFYMAPAPDAPAYVRVGSEVDPDTVVCLIEAMKVMNEIKAEVQGVITEILVENAKPVEFGQKLFAVRPR